MKGFLLDTNILSELRKPRPNSSVLAFVGALPGQTLHVSAVTFAEIRYGIERLDDAERRIGLLRWLDDHLRPQFYGRVIDLSEDVLVLWRSLIEHGRKRGHTFSQPDVLIAACGLATGLIVISRDISEFVQARVPVLNPWTGDYADPSGTTRSLTRNDVISLLD